MDLLRQNEDKLDCPEAVNSFMSKIMPELEQQILQEEKKPLSFSGFPEKGVPMAPELPKHKTVNFNPF